ncbi:glycosyltransferase family 2 protein [Desulfovibrio sp.]|uniref:glycosyltransferase family 2 protein n=1 Tax=Desulfovibrio sp. TaxID=885 RepID=UPI003D13D966
MMSVRESVPLFSVIVPVYNAAQWIAPCIKGLMEQTAPPDEIIFVDDASSDETYELCSAWHHRFPSLVQVLRLSQNLGPGAARNKGIAASKGRYVAFADVDDQLCPQMFKQLLQRIDALQADVAVCGITVTNKNKTKVVLPPKEEKPEALLKEKLLLYAPINKLYKRSFLTDNGVSFTDCRMGEDVAFSVKLFSLQPIVGCVPEPHYTYVRNDSSLSTNLELRKEIFLALDDLKSFLDCRNLSKQKATVYHKLCFLHGVYYPARLFLTALLQKNHSFSHLISIIVGYTRAGLCFIKRNIS